MSVPRIDASGCGSWPTATAQVRECNEEQWEKRREDQGGTLRSTYLQDAVKYQMEERSRPTPKGSPSGPDFARTNREGSGGDDLATRVARGRSTPQTWPTVTAQDAKNDGGPSQSQQNTVPLNAQVKQWATPQVACALGGHLSRGGSRRDELLLGGQVKANPGTQWTTPCADDTGHRTKPYAQGGTATSAQAGGSLNPTWVEWLMAWPRGWTDCEHLVTDRCRRRWHQLSSSWLDALGY